MLLRLLIAALVIIIIIILLIYLYISLAFPGLFINWRRAKHNINSHQKYGSPLLSKQEIKDIKNKLSTLPKRRANRAMEIVGTAAYIDGAFSGSRTSYTEAAKVNNSILQQAFAPLYTKLRSHLTQEFVKRGYSRKGHTKCVYAADRVDGIGLPGFHIFGGNSPLGRGWPVASLHVDKQELQVPWPATETFDLNQTLSYTVAIDVPADSGLYLFSKKEEDTARFAPLWWRLRNADIEKIYYTNGSCYLHEGKFFHMISPFRGDPKQSRITLQGHALYCTSRQEWWLYW